MKIETVQYKPHHAYQLYDRQVREADFFLSSVKGWEEAAERWESVGPAFTLMIDDVPEACGGIAMIDDTFGECWVLIPRSVHGIIVYRAILRGLNFLIARHNFRRVQAFIVEGFEKGFRLVKKLGFVFEGRLEKFGPNGETLHLYAKVF